jgi:CelD/BcsL family acetyltransferase involved in cellulose biosynthesis
LLVSSVHNGWSNLGSFAADWDRILRSCQRGAQGPDATCSYAWAEALVRSHLRDAELRLLTVSSAAQTVAVLPVYAPATRAGMLGPRALCAVTEAHAGRCGLLALDNDPATLDELLDRLVTDLRPWDVFHLTVVENSDAHAALLRAAPRLTLRLRCVSTATSPYIRLADTWDGVFASLAKKMRWTIRKAEKDLRDKGELTYAGIADPAQVDSLLDSIYKVEQSSWKEQSGTSITAQRSQREFYEALIRVAAREKILSAHVLKLGTQPIAYILGIAAGDGAFLDLKESFDASFSEYSPGHVLKRFAIESLIARGVRIYDLMGACEPYKMRWTDQTYTSLRIAVFNRTLRGSAAYWRSRAGGQSKSVPGVTAADRHGEAESATGQLRTR